MIIRIENIKEKGLEIHVSEPPEDFPALREMIGGGEVVFSAPVITDLRAVRISEMVEVEGRCDTMVRLACSRCLTEFEAPLSTSFALTFAKEVPQIQDDSGEEIELSGEEMGLIPFDGDEIDLRPAIEEQLIMALPLRPLCRETCRGLCPECGVDRNREECDCVRPVFNSKFEALKKLKLDNKKD